MASERLSTAGRRLVGLRARRRPPARRRLVAVLAVAVTLVCAFSGGASAISNVPQTGSGTIVVDGAVNALVTVGSTIVLGGAFTHAGPYTGGFASTPVGGGTPTSLPPVNGTVNAVVADGSGGWYVGGNFTSVGTTSMANLVHITSSGVVDTSWDPGPNQQVNTLALSGGTLYVGGQFTSIGSSSRSNLAALTASSGAVTSWNPGADGSVGDLVVSPDGKTVYVAGAFANAGGSARAGLAAVDASSGTAAASWNPSPGSSTVNALAVSPDGATVYAGGTFTTIGGQSLSRLASLSASTGNASATWNPQPGNTVNALALSSDGGTLYAGGTFTSIGGQSRSYVGAVSTSGSGTATSWDPSPSGSSASALALSSDGGTIYVGGVFTLIGGQSRQDVAAVSTSTGAATTWQEDANAAPNAIAAASGGIGVGGGFDGIGLSSRSMLAAISTSGQLLDFDPGVTGSSVTALAASPDGSTVYVGGTFTQVGGQTRTDLAAVSLSTGVTKSWVGSDANKPVSSLVVSSDGNLVYAGLTSSGVGGKRLYALSAATGSTTWSATSFTAITALTLSTDGNTLYVGGSSSPYVAALDASTGSAATWTGSTNAAVQVIAAYGTGSNARVYIGGAFTTVDGTTGRSRLAALDGTGSYLWDADVGAGQVNGLKVSSDGSTIYAAGTFASASFGGATRSGLAAVTSSGSATPWNPGLSGTASTLALLASGVAAGGSWTSIGTTNLPYFAIFTSSVPAVSTSPSVSGTHSVGSTLSCSTGSWTGSPTSYAYQWLRDGAVISGATGSTYGLVAGDSGHQIACRVTATNDEGSASSTSGSVLIVATPTNTDAPVVTGTASVGSLLTCNAGTWTSSPAYSYAWLRDGVAIAGATSFTYTVVSADAGHALSCRVTGKNDAGSAVATSAGVSIASTGAAGGGGTTGASGGGGTAVVASGGGVTTAVSPSAGARLTLAGKATVFWAAGAFSTAGTLTATPYALGVDKDGFSKTSQIVSVAFTAPGATAPTAVFLQKPLKLFFVKSVVPKSAVAADSEDGASWSPLQRLARNALPQGQLDGYFRRRDGSIVIYTRHTALFALLRDIEPPSRPVTVVAGLKGTMLRLRWSPAADNSRRIARYELVRDEQAVVLKVGGSRASATISVASLRRTTSFSVRAVDESGNVGRRSPTITVVVSHGHYSLRL